MDEEKKEAAAPKWETPEVPAVPLTARLRAKLTELDAIHRERVGAVAKMEPRIRAATR
jgi:hypothetical protein